MQCNGECQFRHGVWGELQGFRTQGECSPDVIANATRIMFMTMTSWCDNPIRSTGYDFPVGACGIPAVERLALDGVPSSMPKTNKKTRRRWCLGLQLCVAKGVFAAIVSTCEAVHTCKDALTECFSLLVLCAGLCLFMSFPSARGCMHMISNRMKQPCRPTTTCVHVESSNQPRSHVWVC